MPKPRDVFDDPSRFWSFLTVARDSDFEGQHFDRKEAGRCNPGATTLSSGQVQKIQAVVKECVSAFANRSVEGGLLVLGIACNGAVTGINHLTEPQLNSLSDFGTLLVNQSAEACFHDCTDATGAANRLLLIFTPYTERAICETPGRNPKAWIRSGPQNIPLSQQRRDQLKQRKRIVEFERSFCCEYHADDVDQAVLEQFRRVFLPDGVRELSDEALLYEAGAIIRVNSGYAFTNAGLLFFAANPQRVLPHASIRLLRFEADVADPKARGLPTLDKPFTGPLTKQIRDTRAFFKESGFFKIYPKRKPGGGFIDEPEYPPIAVDEAIVNAVAHRDYAVGRPIECEAYREAFVVRNPGRMVQRDVDLPDEFALDSTVLDSTPRNPKLLEWLKTMRDPEGREFVQVVSEGTKRMRDEMAALSLPPPAYRLTESQTAVKLVSNAKVRAAALRATSASASTEHANLFLLRVQQGMTPATVDAFRPRCREFLMTLKDALVAHKWYIDRCSFGRLVAHRRGAAFSAPKDVSSVLRIYPAYEFQVREYFGAFYLCIDYEVQVLNVRTLNKLEQQFQPEHFCEHRCVANKSGWREGRIISVDGEWAKVFFFDQNREQTVAATAVIPHCPLRTLEAILHRENIRFDIHQAIKRHSLASQPAAARPRAEKILAVAEHLAGEVMPIRFGDFVATLETQPAQLVEQIDGCENVLPLNRLSEPTVVFRQHHTTTDVRDGITRFGAYDETPHTIELVPICPTAYRANMERLIERLKVGKYKYRGSERTFATRFTYSSVVTVAAPEDIRNEAERILKERPEWAGVSPPTRLFLVHTPEEGYTADDEHSPYYLVKRLLLERGVPCQMVDTPTLADPDWKDLNLALNVAAKCGLTPWVLPDAIPDADFFVGLSYTQARDRQRIMGFANVFNSYGKWEFYSGNTTTFEYDKRHETFAALVRDTLRRLSLCQTPNIVFHYAEKLSREDRDTILRAARELYPEGTYTFVWVNSHHNVRFFDTKAETDGSLSRGSYVLAAPNQLYLSTTGYNPFRRALGTPRPLEVSAWVFRPRAVPPTGPDMRAVAVQLLSLTKLNWASTDAFCGEPITLKYAGDIAYLTAAFLRESEPFRLHPALESTPWFL
jgi:predicted HTH transcriptional regulator